MPPCFCRLAFLFGRSLDFRAVGGSLVELLPIHLVAATIGAPHLDPAFVRIQKRPLGLRAAMWAKGLMLISFFAVHEISPSAFDHTERTEAGDSARQPGIVDHIDDFVHVLVSLGNLLQNAVAR